MQDCWYYLPNEKRIIFLILGRVLFYKIIDGDGFKGFVKAVDSWDTVLIYPFNHFVKMCCPRVTIRGVIGVHHFGQGRKKTRLNC